MEEVRLFQDTDPSKLMELAKLIASKTIGMDLVGTKPMTNEEYAEWAKEHVAKDTDPEDDPHTCTKEPYELTEEDYELIKELAPDFMEWIEKGNLTITKSKFGIDFMTSKSSWMSLAGREWVLDKENKTFKLVCMN